MTSVNILPSATMFAITYYFLRILFEAQRHRIKVGLRICFSCTCMLSIKNAKHTDNWESRKFFFELFVKSKTSEGKQAISVAKVVILSWRGRSHELTLKYLIPQ
jgi:hypothetical protein